MAKVALAAPIGLMIGAVALAVRAGAQAPAPAEKPLVPLAASTLASNPEPYYGQVVSVTAAVEQLLSPSAFLVDQDRTKSTGQDILVLAPTLTGVVEPNAYVTVVGELVRFDPAEIARRSNPRHEAGARATPAEGNAEADGGGRTAK